MTDRFAAIKASRRDAAIADAEMVVGSLSPINIGRGVGTLTPVEELSCGVPAPAPTRRDID
jgi:hypothetical protein